MVRDIDLPVLFKNQLILSPGIWNDLDVRIPSIEASIQNTTWDSKSTAIIYSHTPEAEKWVGNLRNPSFQNGSLYGDLELWDRDLAIKLKFGKAPLGISARFGYAEQEPNVPIDMFYENFSIVYKPACTPAMINFSKKNLKDGKLHADILCNNNLSIAEFEGEVTNETSKGDDSEIEANQKIKRKGMDKGEEEASESDLMSVERGLSSKKTMESKENKIEETMETAEEVSAKETATEESQEAELSTLKKELAAVTARVAELEEAESEESEEEASEEEESEEVAEETKEEATKEVAEEAKEEESEKEEEAKSSEMAFAAKELIEAARELKKAAPKTTAEFGKDRIDNYEATTDRLVKDLII